MNKFTRIFITFIFLFLFSQISTKAYNEDISLKGIVIFNELEGGFYEVSGYRLSGNMDFGKYLHKYVIVRGQIDDSPSIFMTKALLVKHIEIIENGKEQLLKELETVSESVKRIYILEQIALLDGNNTDFSIYEMLGEALNSDDISIYWNGKKVEFVQTLLPFIENGRTLAPYSFIQETLNVDITWDFEKLILTIKKNDKEIVMMPDNKTVYVNNEPYYIDIPARIIQNRIVIPVRFVCETLGADVSWVEKGRIVVISHPEDLIFPSLNTLSDFGIIYNSRSISLGDWDYKVDVKSILGNPIKETKYMAGYKWYKTLVFEGLTINYISPDGESFYIEKISVTSSKYLTPRGVKIGDSYQEILKAYDYKSNSEYDKTNHIYTFSDLAISFISFEVRDGIITGIINKIEFAKV